MKILPSIGFVFGVLIFALTVSALHHQKRVQISSEIEVALPLFVQVFMSGGDRFLAANLGSIRSLITDTVKMQPDEYKVMAKVQVDASWLNPAHEDNYYIAAAILPWNDQLEAAQTVLRRASLSRPFDYQPAFYYAFSLLHFNANPASASEWLREAAVKLPEGNDRLLLENLAARWLDRTDDLGVAASVVESMAQQAQRNDFRNYLLLRAQRLRDLMALRKAADAFRQKTGQPLQGLEQLVVGGYLSKLPVDPFGFGYAVSIDGIPNFNAPKIQ